MFDFIVQDLTWSQYPVPTAIHWLQGLLVGFLLVQAHYKEHWHLIGYAALSTLCFLCYESLEQMRIGDSGDIDVLNFTFMLHVSAGITFLVHEIKRKRRENKPKKGYN